MMFHQLRSSRKLLESSTCTTSCSLSSERQRSFFFNRVKAAFLISTFVNPKCANPKILICSTADQSSHEEATLSTVSTLARRRGYAIKDKSVGPFLNLSLESTTQSNQLATISGFLLPNRLHIESYRTLQSQPQRRLLDVSPGMILFIAALAFAKQNRVKWVYGLAIEDAPQQHRRLLRYLKRFGGQYVMTVREDLSSVPARIFYGGFGTIIRGQVDQMLQRGFSMMQRIPPEQRSE